MIRLIAALAALLLPVAASAVPPPAKPPVTIPDSVRRSMLFEFEGNLSNALRTRARVLSDRLYQEQEGGSTDCMVVRAKGRRFRLVILPSKDFVLDATEAQWVDSGCERPDYVLIR